MRAPTRMGDISIAGKLRHRGKSTQRVAMSQWRVNLPAQHEGYITWEEFLANQDRLAKNRTNAGEPILNGPAREGLALLQGLMLCGTCGRAVAAR